MKKITKTPKTCVKCADYSQLSDTILNKGIQDALVKMKGLIRQMESEPDSMKCADLCIKMENNIREIGDCLHAINGRKVSKGGRKRR